MTEPVSQPIFFVVDEDLSAVEAPAGELERRFRAVGAGCEDVLLMRLSGSDSSASRRTSMSDGSGLSRVTAIRTRGWRGCGSWFRSAMRDRRD